MEILQKRKIWYIISGIILIIGLFFWISQGLNLGIDFQGGTIMEMKFDEEVSNEEAREIVAETGVIEDPTIQQTREEGIHGVMIRTRELSTEEISTIREAFEEAYPTTEILRTEMVGPTIGEQLRRNAIWALLVAALAIVIYISIRFEFKFAIVALLTLTHDIVITVGIFALLGREINTAFVAALLTILGYSLNDTIVIFDRIRENMKIMSKKPFLELANQAVVDTLPRSINTSVTTLVTVLAIYLFGGAAIQTFMLALLIGMFAGTYSSIFVASPLLVTWNQLAKRRATS